VTVILWMGEVEEEKPIMREFRSGEGFKKHPYNRLTLSDLYRLLTLFLWWVIILYEKIICIFCKEVV